jgi:hypothetical protein
MIETECSIFSKKDCVFLFFAYLLFGKFFGLGGKDILRAHPSTPIPLHPLLSSDRSHPSAPIPLHPPLRSHPSAAYPFAPPLWHRPLPLNGNPSRTPPLSRPPIYYHPFPRTPPALSFSPTSSRPSLRAHQPIHAHPGSPSRSTFRARPPIRAYPFALLRI